jgi:hypothetical protein
MYHLGAAKSRIAPGLRAHCGHASSTGASVCVGRPSAQDFCAELASTCSENATDCAAWASALTAGDVTDIAGNTLGCRIYHVLAAKADAAPGTAAHCTHASEFGGGQCIDTTTQSPDVAQASFCERFISTCGTGLGWSTASACDAAVSQLPAGISGQTQFNTAACREYHLGVAITFGVGEPNRMLHCTHASDDGGNVCVGSAPGISNAAGATGASSTNNDDLDDTAIVAIVLAIFFGIIIIAMAEMHYQRAAREYRLYLAKEKALSGSPSLGMTHNPTYSGPKKDLYTGTQETITGFDD